MIPIVDGDCVIGFKNYSFGTERIYDSQGKIISVNEKGLKHPLLDPLDVIFVGGSVARSVLRGGIRISFGDALKTGLSVGTEILDSNTISILRRNFLLQNTRELKFTNTTLERMNSPSRYVPIPILKLAIRYGKRRPDTDGVARCFEYTIPMTRWSRTTGGDPTRYILEVVVREKDWTVMHFLYKR